MSKRWVIAAAAALGLGLLTLPIWFTGTTGPIWLTETSGNDDAAPVASHQSLPPGTCDASGAADLDITTKDLDGRDVTLSDYKGKVVLLNFWATWCGPCKVEIPGFMEVYDKYKDRGFVILGVLTDDQPEMVKEFELKMNYPQVMWHDDMDKAYGPIFGLPTSFLITRDGAICRKHMGPVTREKVEQEIAPLL